MWINTQEKHITAGRSYVSKPGDTLAGIAKRAGVSITRLRRANPGLMSSKTLRPGTRVIIPPRTITKSTPVKNKVPRGVRVLVLRPGSRTQEAEGICYCDYGRNQIMVGASALPAPDDLGGGRYTAWLRLPKSGSWLCIPCTACADVWSGWAQPLTNLTEFDHIIITAESEAEPEHPTILNTVLAGELATAQAQPQRHTEGNDRA